MRDDAGPGAGSDRRSVDVKICGLTRREDAETADRHGAAYVGAVLAEGSPRRVDPERAAAIGRGLDARLVLVVVDADPGETVTAARAADAAVIQLHGRESPEMVTRVREAGPWEVWKAVPVRSAADLRDAIGRYADVVDGLLLDAAAPERAGGTGRRFDWETASRTLEDLPGEVRLIVAGGLDPENVARAVGRLGPDVVDVSSGVEAAPGIKDPRRIAAFIDAARAAADDRGERDPREGSRTT